MKRQIKFRGKRTDTGEWIYGSLLKWENGDCEIIVPKSPIDCDKITVDPDTVGQFTGLPDKNGKEIYEHDIVTWYDSDGSPRIDVVKWMRGGLCLCNAKYTVGSYGGLEVIGNTIDNSELLKGGEE